MGSGGTGFIVKYKPFVNPKPIPPKPMGRMRFAVVIVGCALVAFVMAIAAGLCDPYGIAHAQTIIANQKVTVTNGAVVTFTTTDPSITDLLVCSDSVSGTVRYQTDGTNPTTAIGIELYAGQCINIHGRTLVVNFKAIAETATNAILYGQLFRP